MNYASRESGLIIIILKPHQPVTNITLAQSPQITRDLVSAGTRFRNSVRQAEVMLEVDGIAMLEFLLHPPGWSLGIGVRHRALECVNEEQTGMSWPGGWE